jgi:hypothetical protein
LDGKKSHPEADSAGENNRQPFGEKIEMGDPGGVGNGHSNAGKKELLQSQVANQFEFKGGNVLGHRMLLGKLGCGFGHLLLIISEFY